MDADSRAQRFHSQTFNVQILLFLVDFCFDFLTFGNNNGTI